MPSCSRRSRCPTSGLGRPADLEPVAVGEEETVSCVSSLPEEAELPVMPLWAAEAYAAFDRARARAV